MTITRWWRAPALALVAVLALTGCTGIPDSSAPQTVTRVPLDPGDAGSVSAPPKNAAARVIVTQFLDANSSDAANPASVRAFLTPTARNQWSDQRVTIIANRQIPTGDEATGTLEVTGNVVGTINADGVYQSSLQGSGNGGRATPFPFTLRKIDGQLRIDQLRNGLLITEEQFRQYYQQHVIYYYDLSEKALVPDVRWSAIPSTDGGRLATWLLDELVSAPRPELQDIVSTDTFPAQANADRVSVRSSGSALRVEIPGSSQLDPGVINRLAEQLSRTLDEVLSGRTLTITDGGSPVTVPALGVASFPADSFPPDSGGDAPVPAVYYLDNGRVVQESGKRLSGALGDGSYYLSSLAVTRRTASSPLLAAGVVGSGTLRRLYVGTQSAGLAPTSVRGELTRPAWAPHTSEVWLGNGATVHRVTVSGQTAKDSVVQMGATVGGGRIESVRISPDGLQVALVIAGTDDTGQLYVGAIVRDAGTVRISGLQAVSPSGVVITDADWSSSLKLTAIGSLASSSDASVFSTYVDGSLWTNLGLGNLPAPPVSITASTNGAWVESEGQVWEQTGSSWSSPSSSGQAFGAKPVYLT